MKKTISLLLTLVMILSLVPAAFAASDHAGFDNFLKTESYYDGRFIDVSSTDWFSSSVQAAYELGLMNGGSPRQFIPNGNITIAETLAIACRINSIYQGKDADFSNNGGLWYQPYIDYAIQNKMILSNEYSDYTKAASRANFANMIYASLPSSAWTKINNVDRLPDVASNEWYSTPVFALYNAGILKGNDKYGTFNPSSNITRGEVATIITRVAVPAARETFALESRQAVNVFLKNYLTSKENNLVGYNKDYNNGLLAMEFKYVADENAFVFGVSIFDNNIGTATILTIPYSLETPYSGIEMTTTGMLEDIVAVGEFSINPHTYMSETNLSISNFRSPIFTASEFEDILTTAAIKYVPWVLEAADLYLLQPNGYTLKDLGFEAY